MTLAPHSTASQEATSLQHEPPLVVDLDGTLIYSDMLWESLLQFLKTQFWHAWLLPLWLLLGKAGFKARLAGRVALDPAALPYDQRLLDDVRAQRERGRTVVLATGSERRVAERIAAHLGLFERVLATGEGVNLTSSNKADALVRLYGQGGDDYVGNARADIPVWRASRHAYSVTLRPFALGGGRRTEQMGSRRAPPLRALAKGLRPRQWLKNFLVFVPMLAGHALDQATLGASLLAFAAFSLCASSAYLLNDALDAQDDRRHPAKRHRPIAAGTLPLPLAMVASPLLAFASGGMCLALQPSLLPVLLAYFAGTLAYSLWLKRILMVDIVGLALLYTLRILGGSAATGITPSFWLLAFSFFIFLSLALLKRYSELYNLQQRGLERTSGRGYLVADKAMLAMMGVSGGFMAVLVFILYFNSEQVLRQYARPEWLLGVAPLLVFWLGRLWLLASRGLVNEDPVLYLSRDRSSLAVFGLCVLLAVAAAGQPSL